MKKFSGAAIPRHQVFTLADGTYVVQWQDKRVQELLTGQYREYEHQNDFGHAITEWELKQLKAGGRVEHFNRTYVWLYPLPEAGRFGRRQVLGRGNRIHLYYLATSYPAERLSEIRAVLENIGVADRFRALVREGSVAILKAQGELYAEVDEAREAQQFLYANAPRVFGEVVVAFLERSRRSIPGAGSNHNELSLDALIASQTNTRPISGKRVVAALNRDDEREAFAALFDKMDLEARFAESATSAVELLEDLPTDLLIIDLQLPDMHGWQMVGKLREIERLRELPIIVLADQPNFGMTVAGVDYLQRPISIARLRLNVYVALTESHTTPGSPSNSGEVPPLGDA